MRLIVQKKTDCAHETGKARPAIDAGFRMERETTREMMYYGNGRMEQPRFCFSL